MFNNDRDSRLLAVAVTDIYDGDFVPATNDQVRNYLTNKVRNSKKADKLIADYKGKDQRRCRLCRSNAGKGRYHTGYIRPVLCAQLPDV